MTRRASPVFLFVSLRFETRPNISSSTPTHSPPFLRAVSTIVGACRFALTSHSTAQARTTANARCVRKYLRLNYINDPSLLCLQKRAEVLLQLRLVVTPYVAEVVVSIVVVVSLPGEARRRLVFVGETFGGRRR